MKTNHLFASMAVTAVLVITAPAQAQILGGGVRGGAGGAFAGSFRGPGGMAGANGRVGGGTDASMYRNIDARRAAPVAARDTAMARDHAAHTAGGAARSAADAGSKGSAVAAAGGNTATAAGNTVTAGGDAQGAARSGKSAPSSVPAPARSGKAGSQSTAGSYEDRRDPASPHEAQGARRAPGAQGSPATRSPEELRPVATETDASASASLRASTEDSTQQ